MEPLQQCFQLAAVTFCQLLSRLHLFPESIMRGVTYSWAPVERIYQEFSPQEVREEERKGSFFFFFFTSIAQQREARGLSQGHLLQGKKGSIKLI